MKRIFSKVIKIYINCFYKEQKLSRGVLGSSCSRNDRKVRLHVTILFTNLFEALQKTASKSTVFYTSSVCEKYYGSLSVCKT